MLLLVFGYQLAGGGVGLFGSGLGEPAGNRLALPGCCRGEVARSRCAGWARSPDSYHAAIIRRILEAWAMTGITEAAGCARC